MCSYQGFCSSISSIENGQLHIRWLGGKGGWLRRWVGERRGKGGTTKRGEGEEGGRVGEDGEEWRGEGGTSRWLKRPILAQKVPE